MKWFWALMFGVGMIAVSSLLTLAAMPVQCKVQHPPKINVYYDSAPVQYDFSKGEDELARMGSDTVNPYGATAKTSTEGLRLDQPTFYTETQENIVIYPTQNAICMSYDAINIHVALKPVIFIASKWKPGTCRDTILGHERRHITVDHQIMTEFIPLIRKKVEQAADEIGTVGPLDKSQEKKTAKFMTDHIEIAVTSQLQPIHREMRRLQGQVDSLQEYQRVDAICRGRD